LRILALAREQAGGVNPLLVEAGFTLPARLPLQAGDAIPATAGALRIASADRPAPDPAVTPSQPEPEPERRSSPMPEPSTNGRPPERGGINDLINEGEELRTLLNDATIRLGRLLAALKQHRRQARAVQAAVASLKQMQLDH
jgi:hypothetical protein